MHNKIFENNFIFKLNSLERLRQAGLGMI